VLVCQDCVPTTRRFLLDWYLEVFLSLLFPTFSFVSLFRSMPPFCEPRRSTLSGGVWNSADPVPTLSAPRASRAHVGRYRHPVAPTRASHRCAVARTVNPMTFYTICMHDTPRASVHIVRYSTVLEGLSGLCRGLRLSLSVLVAAAPPTSRPLRPPVRCCRPVGVPVARW
jgi:hypothetical protein